MFEDRVLTRSEAVTVFANDDSKPELPGQIYDCQCANGHGDLFQVTKHGSKRRQALRLGTNIDGRSIYLTLIMNYDFFSDKTRVP